MKRKKHPDLTGCPICGGRLVLQGGFRICQCCKHVMKHSKDFDPNRKPVEGISPGLHYIPTQRDDEE